jgi:hypothetical protein
VKALVYEKAQGFADFAIKLVEIPVPTLRENDVLVDVRAIGVKPSEKASGILGEGRHKARRLSQQIRPEWVNAGQSTSARIGKPT